MRFAGKLKKTMIALVAAVTFTTTGLGVVNATLTAQAASTPSISAKAAIAVDASTGQILYNKNSTKPMAIASMTKMLSTYLVLKAIHDGKLSWNQKISVSKAVAKMSQNTEYANVPLLSTKKYSVRQLYNATEIYSANAAITALGDAVAGSPHKFVQLMRKTAKSFGITDATIINASGLTNKEVGSTIGYSNVSGSTENEMSAQDVATVAQKLLSKYPEVLKTSSIAHAWFEKGTKSATKMDNRNYMLKGLVKHYSALPVDGLKTGTSTKAGNAFTGTVKFSNGNRIITVVMHAGSASDTGTERFTQTAQIMSYVYHNYTTTTVAKDQTLKGVKSVAVQDGKTLSTKLVTNGKATKVYLPTSSTASLNGVATLKKSATTNGKLQAPLTHGKTIGTAKLSLNKKAIQVVNGTKSKTMQVNLTSQKSVEKANIFVRMWRGIKSWF
ncbi:D-alanyl-D-alanine carboxypeptidase family protein [Lactiplantibacillus mudanjiangensis]|uniref:serine-type D-Ala-D-Ala carboxypeptidase n=1 Tax=Lactiplantibacillus mudanjiangensis TaxID=1296538 RepID=A0A660E338_9LACO|nr:D-alanyl-D-alanine carboxypeptidase family protein [Lactiplantibacillus mudanjiangensis]VDG24005.1 serine-type D-Ala-D-Ala carboxypeptidase [Lactobacillus plantarum JDM1] [Lactiplantibacillus mudanjiangensis]VDG27235.1 serine-type D-Ala-D-Ala carboxypeptidase [Lactobacillus plantarum JDM1] [Lactiplantibacillus mudanjiangensis]